MTRYMLTICLLLLSLRITLTAQAQNDAGAVRHSFLCCDNGQGKDFVVSADGKVVWEFAVPVGQDVWRLPNGNYLLSNVRGVQEVAPDKKVVWQYTSPEGTEVHGCQPLADGSVMVCECGTSRIVEVDRQGKIRKEVKLETKTVNVHAQFRVARKLTNGNYLVAHVGENLVREYDGEGKVLRTIPTPGNPFVGVRLPNGNTLIGCGDGHKVIEVDTNDKIVWQIDENELPGNPLRFVAGLQRLPNGNTLVCNWGGHGHIGEQPLLFEVTPDKKVVWKMDDYQQFRTISNVQLLDVAGDVTKGEILR
ncbi:MAG: hypothetical protein HY318_15400 [Armatimonadetes bacterium]|nr:hypothetical protein [Armatimonadota bacterium]